MMVRLRYPRIDWVDTRPWSPDELDSPNRIQSGQVCETCAWPDRCRRDRICWQREKADIARERLDPPARPWDTVTIIEAIRAWTRRHGQPPTSTEWMCVGPGRPAAHNVMRVFGTWNNAIRAAGYTPGRRRRPKD